MQKNKFSYYSMQIAQEKTSMVAYQTHTVSRV